MAEKKPSGAKRKPRVAEILVRDIREGDVVELHSREATIVRRYPAEVSSEYVCLDWRAPDDDPGKPPHRMAVRHVGETVPLLRRPEPEGEHNVALD